MGSDLYSINTELMEIQRLIGSARFRLDEKKEELKRLKEALSSLGSNKSDFIDMKRICMEPEFSSNTLRGKNADDLTNFKESELQVSFVAIPNEQISDAESKLSTQIEAVQQEIAAIESNITSMENQHANLLIQKHKVENQS